VTIWIKAREVLRYMRTMEPARVQAIWRAVIGLLAAVGVVIPGWLDGRVSAVIAAVYVLLTITQGEQTRSKVIPVARVHASLTALALSTQSPKVTTCRDSLTRGG